MNVTGNRILRGILIGFGSVVGLIVLLLSAASLAVYTEAGSRRIVAEVLSRVNTIEGFNLQTTSISGNLLRGLTLTGATLDIPAAHIEASSLRAAWNPWSVLSGSFYFSEFVVSNLDIDVLPDDGSSGESDPVSLFRLQPLPVNLAVGNLEVQGLQIETGSGVVTVQQVNMAAQLTGQELQLNALHVDANSWFVDIDLQATLDGDIPLLASVNWEYQGALFANYDYAVGAAAITGNLRQLSVQHELLAPEPIHSEGIIVQPLAEISRSLQFEHTLAALRLPYESVATWEFETISLMTSWSGADLELDLAANLSLPQLPRISFDARGRLGTSILDITDLQLRTDTGSASASGTLDWSEDLTGAAQFSVSEANPLQYLPVSIPVDLRNLSTTGDIGFAWMNGERQLTLTLDEFAGTTGEFALTGETALALQGNILQIQNLRLNTIANEIRLTGSYDEAFQLDWELDAPELAQVLTGISGAAQGSGRVEGALENPAITASLELQDIVSGELTLGAATVSLAGTREQLRANAEIDSVTFAAADVATIESLDIELEGNTAAHTLRANLQSSLGALTLALTGGVADPAVPVWEGSLDSANLRSEFGNWTKRSGSNPLRLSRDSFSIADVCWSLQDSEICADGARDDSGITRFSATLQNFPLAEFNNLTVNTTPLVSHAAFPRLPTGLQLDGSANANLRGTVTPGATSPTLNFSLSSNEAILSIASTESVDEAIDSSLLTIEDQKYYWDNLSVDGELTNGTWSLSGNAALSQQNVEGTNLGLNGRINSTLRISQAGNLNGDATAAFAELGWIQAFLPALSNVNGSLEGDVSIGGTLDAPVFSGELNLRDGSAEITQLGIQLDAIHSELRARSDGEIQLSGSLASQAGLLDFAGDLHDVYRPSRNLEATISGTGFWLADLPDAKLAASPDIRITADHELIQLRGSLDIPVLDLTLRELPETAVDVSRDAMVVSYPADRPELARSIAANQSTLFDIPVAADINLTLGDAVKVRGFGMEATLDGNLAIQQRADGHNLTYGELSIVEGNYRLYGQTLNLRQGKLLFFGALDNPALDIRAVREAEGVTAGVLMNGTLKHIHSQLFSTPVLPDNDIIAVLVTGRPASELGEQDGTAVLGAIASLGLDRSEGLTNQIRDTLGLDTLGINSSGNINNSMLTIGKYLTPDIFVHYGVGLFDRQSKVAIDYSLSDRVMLQAESGEYQSIDLTYTVER